MLFGPERGSAFTVSSHLRQGAIIIRVGGELDFRSVPVLREHLNRVWDLADTPVLIVDLTAVSFCDSVGLSELLAALQRSEATGVRLMLSGVQGVLARVLSLTGLRNAFDIHPSCARLLSENRPHQAAARG
jgi:anti-sigma B factor antagonist